MPVAEVDHQEIIAAKPPFRHDLDKAAIAHEFGLHHGGRSPIPPPETSADASPVKSFIER